MAKEFMRDLVIVPVWTLLMLGAMGQMALAGNVAPYPGTVVLETKHSYKGLVARLDEIFAAIAADATKG